MCLTACATRYSDFFPCHDDGTLKPSVCLLPVIDRSDSHLPWDMASQFSEKIRTQLMYDGRLFIPPKDVIERQLSSTGYSNDAVNLATTVDLKPFLKFQPEHFVIVMELVEHRTVPYIRGKIKPIYPSNLEPDHAVVLLIKLRIRVVDIRGGEPRIVRQELIESNHVIDKTAIADAVAQYGTKTFGTTQLAIAHARLCQDIVAKIEQLTCFRR